MGKVIALFIFFSCIEVCPLAACDVCSQYDYANLNNQHYLGFFYHREVFNGYNTYNHTPHFSPSAAKLAHGGVGPTDYYIEPTQRDYQVMNTVELRYNHNFKDNYNVAIMIPFRHHKDHYSVVYPPLGQAQDSTSFSSGFGDLVITADKLSTIAGDQWTHRFKYGAGISLPTGRFSLEDDDGNPSEPRLEPGKGAYTAFLRLSYSLTKQKRWGFITFSTYARSLNALTGDPPGTGSPHFSTKQYHFGDVLYNSITGFRTILLGTIRIIPRLSMTSEWSQPNQLNGEVLESTGHMVFFMTPGIDVAYDDFTLRLQHNTPIRQRLKGEQLSHAGRLTTALLYSF